MSIVLTEQATQSTRVPHSEPANRPPAIPANWPLFLYGALVLLTCLWVSSLPLLPSQDSPLHLYYVNVFRQLLAHQHTVYTDTYSIRHLLPPYATYYYGLIALGHFVSLETADKLFLCGSIALLGTAGCLLIRTVAPTSRWAPFLLLPVLLNWPSFMGFSNFMLAIDLACLALAAWCMASSRSGLRYTVSFLLIILAMVFTHPVPWLFTLSFAALELSMRALRHRGQPLRQALRNVRRDIATLALASLAFFYFRQFRSQTQLMTRRVLSPKLHSWVTIHPATSWARLHSQAFSLLHTQGIVLFLGHGLPHLYRDGIGFLMDGAFILALWSAITRHRQARAQRQTQLDPTQFTQAQLHPQPNSQPNSQPQTLPQARAEAEPRPQPHAEHLIHTWLLFSFLLAAGIILMPDSSAGGYYLTTRLQLLLYICCVVAASDALTRLPRLAPTAASLAIALQLLTLGLAARYITPVARTIAALRALPAVPADPRPGLLMRPVGAAFPPHLNFDAYNWAPVHYFRWHSLLLYNTAWLGDTLIPIRPRPNAPSVLDTTFFNQAPEFGDTPLYDDLTARHLLNRVSFTLLQRDAIKHQQNPFAEEGASPTPGEFAQGWSCQDSPHHHWTLCQPTPTPQAISK